MSPHRKLPPREHVFVLSLLYHGFRITRTRTNLKARLGYVIPATKYEDSSGIDFFVKMPRDLRIFPIQVTQRGVRLFRKHELRITRERLEEFMVISETRIRAKRKRAKKNGIAFVLVRDFDGMKTNSRIAWGDIKALRHGIAHLKRWL